MSGTDDVAQARMRKLADELNAKGPPEARLVVLDGISIRAIVNIEVANNGAIEIHLSSVSPL